MDPKQFQNMREWANSLKKQVESMQPYLNEIIKKAPKIEELSSPKLIKQCTINKKSAKITLFADNSIKIEFEDKEYGEKYYNTLK